MTYYDNRTYKEIYRDIREQSKIKEFRKAMLAGHFFTRDIGRICSPWFVKRGILPNQITVFMILFGIIGSILFAIPNIWCKIVGYLCWLMWFAMDCSDGQVARYTKTFSKYGTEMDYMAHLIDHPLMNIAIWLTYVEMSRFNTVFLSLVFLVSISCELIMRNICTFDHYARKIANVPHVAPDMSYLRYFWRQLCLYPNMVICFSWIIVLDYILDSGFSLFLYLFWLCCFFINFLISQKLTIKNFLK